MTPAEESYFRAGLLTGIIEFRKSIQGCVRGDIERRLDYWIENVSRWAHKADNYTSFRPPPAFLEPADLAACIVPRPGPRVRPLPPRDAISDRMAGLRGPPTPEPYVAVTDQKPAGGRIQAFLVRDNVPATARTPSVSDS